MKILVFHPVNDYSGSTTALANMIEHENPNEPVDVVTDGIGYLSKCTYINTIQILPPVHKHYMGITYFYKLWRMSMFAFKYRKRYDLYYLNTIMVYPVALVSWITKTPLVWHIHEKFNFAGNLQSKCEHLFMEWVFRHTKCKRVFVSEYVKNQYEQRDDSPYCIKNNYLSKSFLEKVYVKPISERCKNTVVLVSSLTKSKGLFNYIKVARLLPKYNFNLVLSAGVSEITAFFSDTKMPSNLFVISKPNFVGDILRESDLLVNLTDPSYAIETFGMTIIEGFAYGLPAIVPNIGGPIEIVKNGYTGYCLDVTDVNLVAYYIEMLLSSPEYSIMTGNCLLECRKYC